MVLLAELMVPGRRLGADAGILTAVGAQSVLFFLGFFAPLTADFGSPRFGAFA